MSETADDLVKSPAYFRLDYWECAGGKGRWGIGVAADILAIEARLNALESSSPVQSAQKTAAAVANDPVREGEPVASEGPGDGYRWVLATGPDGPGEVHEKGDECPDCLGIWRPVRHVIGRVCDEPGIYRRRITPAESVPDDAGRRLVAGEPMTVAEMRHALGVARHEIARLTAERDAALRELQADRVGRCQPPAAPQPASDSDAQAARDQDRDVVQQHCAAEQAEDAPPASDGPGDGWRFVNVVGCRWCRER